MDNTELAESPIRQDIRRHLTQSLTENKLRYIYSKSYKETKMAKIQELLCHKSFILMLIQPLLLRISSIYGNKRAMDIWSFKMLQFSKANTCI